MELRPNWVLAFSQFIGEFISVCRLTRALHKGSLVRTWYPTSLGIRFSLFALRNSDNEGSGLRPQRVGSVCH